MSIVHIFILAVIQGLTEFLPVSSSGHLILLPQLTGLQDQGLALDVAVHVGTLFAVVLYFWKDVRMALAGIPSMLSGNIDTPGARLAFLLLVATIPVILAGLVLKLTGLSSAMRSITVIGWAMIIFGAVLYLTDRSGGTGKADTDWSLKDAIVLGLWQAIALIPGTSRSGATISGARALGYDRSSAAKLAMLMSIPTIVASGTLLGLDVVGQADAEMLRNAAFGIVFAFAAALLALSLMMRLLRSISFTPYVIYRILLGIVLLAIAYT
ncbi:undecaprenyl-diphosphate phosphatase [Algirhabdus cladophorae]|uniref:undecaprenyl-diphosphate phosphatase n=1 Tax=Algirhabdus cladophorae TaxID=3377108 RepID=UPI003B8465EB